MAGRKPDFRLMFVEDNGKGRKVWFKLGSGCCRTVLLDPPVVPLARTDSSRSNTTPTPGDKLVVHSYFLSRGGSKQKHYICGFCRFWAAASPGSTPNDPFSDWRPALKRRPGNGPADGVASSTGSGPV